MAALVSLCLCCPLGLFLAFCAGPLALHGLGVSADTAEAVGLFCARLVPGLGPAALTVVKRDCSVLSMRDDLATQFA